jgi:hypothetical protein
MASAIDFKCYDLNSATNYKKFTSFGTLGSTNTLYTFRGSATFFSTNPVTAIRLLTNGAGTISGNYAIFGIL